MYKKIIIGLLISLTVYAFPTRLLEVSESVELILKIFKRLIYCAIIFILLWRYKLLQDIGFKYSPDVAALKKLIPAIFILIIYLLLNTNKFLQNFEGRTYFLFLTLIATFFGAFAEEIFFRGYLFTLLKKEGYSTRKSIFASSLIFAGLHIINVFRYADIWSVINQIGFAVCMGIMLCSIFALSKNILIVSLYHFIINIPSALSSVFQINNETDVPPVSSFSENLISTLVFFVLLSPLIMVSIHYLKLIRKENV